MTNIGEKIKESRIKNNLTQSELGDKLFVSDKTINLWRNKAMLKDCPDISS